MSRRRHARWGDMDRQLKQGLGVRCEPSGSVVGAANIEYRSTSGSQALEDVSRRLMDLCGRAEAFCKYTAAHLARFESACVTKGNAPDLCWMGAPTERIRSLVAREPSQICGLDTWECSRCGVSGGGGCRPHHVPLLPLRTLT
jgi:hypothetical protein